MRAAVELMAANKIEMAAAPCGAALADSMVVIGLDEGIHGQSIL